MQLLNPDFITSRLPFLQPGQFAALCNDILSATARIAGIPVSSLRLNLSISDPDGGIDAACENSPKSVGRLIHAGDCGYQFKSGMTRKSARDVARDDIVRKVRVMELLSKGDPFVYLAASDHGDAFESDVAHEVREQGVQVEDRQIVVITGHTLAHLLRSVPATVARLLGLDVPLAAFEEWSQRESMSNPYRGDEPVRSRIEDLRRLVARPSSRIRIVGAPGDGKTRTVLEALRGTDIEGGVLYASQADDVQPGFLSFLRTTPDVQCTLVIDEVDEATAQDLNDRLSTMPEGVRSILIGVDASATSQLNTLKIEGLSNESLVAIIEAIALGVPRATSEEIASVCEQSPKFAVLLARRINDDPALANHHVRLKDPHIQNVLDQYLPQDRDEWNALSAVALLERLGWEREGEEECRLVYETLGMDVEASRRIVEALHRQHGIAPRAGRFRYVSPRILADHLAARLIGSWTTATLRQFVQALPPKMAESFSRRLRGLAGALANRAAVEEVILGDQGPFRTLEDVGDNGASFLLRYLAGPFRHATLRALRRIFDSASDADLRLARRSRRDLVWALEELLWPEDTFSGAARLLLRLAANETEDYGNNATGIFTETFQIWLGRTAAGPEPRLQILREATASPDSSTRKLAAMTFGKALTISNISRMGVPPKEVPGMPEEAWQPATHGDIWRMAISLVTTMRPLLQDSDVAVRSAAADALADGIEAAIKFPGMLDAWVGSGRLLIGAPYDVRKPVLTGLEWRLERETLDSIGSDATEETKEDVKAEVLKDIHARLGALSAFFDELKGGEFSSRFRWVLSTDPWRPSLRGEANETRAFDEAQDQLATEVLGNPVLFDAELGWLFEVKGHLPEVWIERLAARDPDRRMWERLLAASKENERAIGWVSLYHLAQRRRGAPGEVTSEEVESIAQLGAGPLQAFDLLVRAGYSPDRLSAMLRLFRSHAIGGHLLRRVTFSTWRQDIPAAELETLIEAVLDTSDGQDAAIALLSFYLHFNPASVAVMGGIALRVLELTVEHGRPGVDSSDEWAEVAKQIVHSHAVDVTRVVLRRLERTERFHTDQLKEVLRKAWKKGDKARLFSEFYAGRIESRDLGGWRLRTQLEHFPFHEVGDEYLLAWVAEQPTTRAHALAQLIGRPLGKPSALHAALLERFPEQGVGDAFLSDLISGTWWGSAASRTRGLIQEVTGLLEDDRPAIQEWARSARRSLEEMLRGDELREAEERFR